MDWLAARHLKGWNTCFTQLRDEMLTQEVTVRLSRLDPETLSAIQINLTEWVLAEGTIQVQGTFKRVPDYLLGPTGPQLTLGQRDWLLQMAQRPLRLYDVTDVVPGVQMTLCDTLNNESGPMVIQERSGSRNAKPGMQLGCRIMRAGEHFELSGAIYPFSMLAGQAVIGRLHTTADEFSQSPNLARETGRAIMSAWLQQYVAPPAMSAMSAMSAVSTMSTMVDIDPQTLAQATEDVIQRTYAHWPDEPIPLLGNKTPRQAIQTAAGLERVKGLIRSYEVNEKEQAAQQGRAAVSYHFLWEAIGVTR